MSVSMLCKVCVSEQSEFVNMFNLYYGSIPAAKFIMDILQIKINKEKLSSTNTLIICKRCNAALSNFYDFYIMVRDAQRKYHEMINKNAQASRKYIIIYPQKRKIADEEFKKYGISQLVQKVSQTNVKIRQETSNKKNKPNTSNDANQLSEDDGEVSDICDATSDKSDEERSIMKSVTESCRSQSKLFLRRKIATKAMLTKYKMGEMTDGKQWLLADDQIEEMLSLYVDMKCVHCAVPPFNTYTQLEQHSMEEHDTFPVVQCCKTNATNRESLKSHILYSHILQRGGSCKTRLVPCPVCKKLVRDAAMKGHLFTHLPEDKREFQCDQCDKKFGIKSHLTYHISHSHSNLNIVCEDCGKTFKSKFHLNCHRKNVHSTSSDNFYLCPDCGKKIKNLAHYETHMKEHQGIVERVKCHICDVVVKKYCFSSHLRSHDPKNIKQCPHCPHKSYHLLDHIKRVHNKIKPFTCTYCTMTFYNVKTMEDHIASRHTGIPAYTCEFCNKTFMSNANHHTHRKRMHPEQWAEMKSKMTTEKNKVIVPDSTVRKVKRIVEGAEADLVMQNIQCRTKKPEVLLQEEDY